MLKNEVLATNSSPIFEAKRKNPRHFSPIGTHFSQSSYFLVVAKMRDRKHQMKEEKKWQKTKMNEILTVYQKLRKINFPIL